MIPQSNKLAADSEKERIEKCLEEILAFAKGGIKCDDLGIIMALRWDISRFEAQSAFAIKSQQ